MIIDTSALATIALNWIGSDDLLTAVGSASSLRISAGNLLEAYIVIDRRQSAPATAILEQLLERFGLIVEPVTEAQVDIARGAYRRYGKGSGHPARLNYGDCFAYALARYLDKPLLFIGNDFAQTDIPRAQ
ncbi:MAG: type II toxin-antitoxin system VapC family toxin [Chloroflexia bacterium]|nr:type II toxin-antitoxin system VapC family toxin [Chloroflexia bacterium]